MQPTFFNEKPPAPQFGPDVRIVTATGSATFGENMTLRAIFLTALGSLGADLRRNGVVPADIRTLAIHVPDTKAFMDDLVELDLLYREMLGGNAGTVGLLTSDGVVSIEAVLAVSPPSYAPVYRGLTKAEVNREYSPRAIVPEAADIMANWRIQGTAFQKTRTAEIYYGSDPKHAIDLYLPENKEKPPIMIFIHGGYWQALDKRDNSHLCAALVDAGVAVASVNYPLCPPSSIAEIIRDCQTAAAVLYRNEEGFGYDATRITVCGHSAGGHLAAVLGRTDWPSISPDLPADLIKGCLPISGVFDVEPLVHTGLNAALNLDVAGAQAVSATRMDSPHAGPVICAVGGDESESFRQQSENYTKLAKEISQSAEYLELPGKNHFTVVEALNEPDSPLYEAAVDMATSV